NIQDIESVEVLRNANYTAIYGMNGGNGLIILTSKTGLSAMRNYVPRGILTIQPQGISLAKELYKLQYEANTELNLHRDLSTTIHWESDRKSTRLNSSHVETAYAVSGSQDESIQRHEH